MWGEKSINNGFFLKELSQLYPEALFIKIFRDPRSCILSKFNKKRMRINKDNHDQVVSPKNSWINRAKFFAKHAASWSAWYQAIDLQISKYIKPENLINLKYEDFIKQPEIHLSTICSRLGIPFDEKKIDYDSDQPDPVLLSEAAYAHQNITKKIDQSRTHSYKEMAHFMVWVVEKFAGPQMIKYGYGMGNPNLYPIERVLLKVLLKKRANNIEDYVRNKLQSRCVDSNHMPLN